jgi:hypothetical protein
MSILQRLLLAAQCAPLPPPPSDARLVELAVRAVEAEAAFLSDERPYPERPACMNNFDGTGAPVMDPVNWRIGRVAAVLVDMDSGGFVKMKAELTAYAAAVEAHDSRNDALRTAYTQALDDYLEATGRKRRYAKLTQEQRDAVARRAEGAAS